MDLFATILEYVGLGQEKINENTPSRSFAPMLRGEKIPWENEVFMEQEETRSIRTENWLYMKRFQGSRAFQFEDELFDLSIDPDERENVASDTAYSKIADGLRKRIDSFFIQYANPLFDLWAGGSA